jgi:hypothetical protein
MTEIKNYEKSEIYSPIRHRAYFVFVFDVSGGAASTGAVCDVRRDELRAASREKNPGSRPLD